jgi:hypothetical protein
MNTTFISHSLAVQDRYLLSLLATKLNEVGFQLVSNAAPSDFQANPYVLAQIQNASLAIGLITCYSHGFQRGFVAQEINFARQLNKPVILLVEEGVAVGGVLQDFPNTVTFNRQNIHAAIEQVKNRIKAPDYTAAWVLGGVAVLALLAYLGDPKK